MTAATKEVLGLDVGSVRTGVARGSSAARLAEPMMSLKTSEAVSFLRDYVDRHNIEAIVVGLPRNLKGDDTKQTDWVRQWVNGAKDRVQVPFFWQDEALTSRLAEARSLAAKKVEDIDALAAAIILQDFFDTPEADRIVC